MLLDNWLFAVAGLAAAAGPILIHLLRRWRFRRVEWAAMEFLRQAVRRRRRAIRLRNWLLLALRILCVAVFGLAMARPYFRTSSAQIRPHQPLHAVLIVDNSMSMGFRQLGGTLLDQAKQRAATLIGRLPPRSRYSILPLCGPENAWGRFAHLDKQDALDALAAIETVDRAASVLRAVELAADAFRRVALPAAKRVILFSDQQITNWPPGSLAAELDRLPVPMEFVRIAADNAENASIEDFKLQGGVADLTTPATFLATVRYQGRKPRDDVQIALTVDGVPVATQSLRLRPGQRRQVRFPPYRFDVPTSPGQPAFVPAAVSLSADRLPADDRRFLAVPVVQAVPVVFIDQYGHSEDPGRNLLGDTYRLRHLLATASAAGLEQDRPVEVRHVTVDRVDGELLTDVPMVIMAGVLDPAPAVSLLREFVEQGGCLVIAAGGRFDPIAWTASAWLDGGGILPWPLKPLLVGGLPGDSAGPVQPFQLDVASLNGDYFLLEQTPPEALESLYRLPYFFQAVEVDCGQAGDLSRTAASGGVSAPSSDVSSPRVLARFTNGVPMMVRQEIGNGRIVFVSTGVFRRWNTWTAGNAVLVFDRIFRDALGRSLPDRTLLTSDLYTLPVAGELRYAQFTLTRPDGREEPLPIEALAADSWGLAARDLFRRGIYRVTAGRIADTQADVAEEKLWQTILAVNGPAGESELTALDEAGFGDRIAGTDARWVDTSEAVGMSSAGIWGQGLWKWLIRAVLAGLLLEMAILAAPSFAKGETA